MTPKIILQKIIHFQRHAILIQKNLPVLSRVLSGYFRTLVLKQNVLRTVEFTVTGDCNVNCEMCYATRIVQKKKKYLTPSHYHSIWQQAKKLGAFSAIISGGEATMRKDLFEVIEALEPKQTLIALVTNSTLLSQDYLVRLKNSGINIIHLSLNSVDPEVNDRMRDFQGHFEHTKRISKEAKDLGFEVCLSKVVSHNAFGRTKEVAEFAKKHDLGVVFSLACPTGNWANARAHLLSPDEWRTIDQYMKENPHIRADWTINFSMKNECPGGREKICISHYGDVMGCGMNFISLGNVLEEPLEVIWERMCSWGPFKKRSDKCLIALDPEYLEEYLLPIAGNDVLPVSVEDHPVHPMPLHPPK